MIIPNVVVCSRAPWELLGFILLSTRTRSQQLISLTTGCLPISMAELSGLAWGGLQPESRGQPGSSSTRLLLSKVRVSTFISTGPHTLPLQCRVSSFVPSLTAPDSTDSTTIAVAVSDQMRRGMVSKLDDLTPQRSTASFSLA